MHVIVHVLSLRNEMQVVIIITIYVTFNAHLFQQSLNHYMPLCSFKLSIMNDYKPFYKEVLQYFMFSETLNSCSNLKSPIPEGLLADL